MLTHAPDVLETGRAVPGLLLQPPELRATLFESLGSIEDEDNILVLGGDGPDLMCALLRAGARNVTHLRAFERLEAGSASMVIVPRVRSLDWLDSRLSSIRHALVDNGRLVVCAHPLPINQIRVRRMLNLHGFTAIRINQREGCQIVSAEAPAFGHRRPNDRSH
jgi:hypothetical protein